MTLLRPEHTPHISQETGVALEAKVEQQILTELQGLSKTVVGIKHEQEMMAVRLLGDVNADTPHGRLPILERTVRDHGERLGVVETNQTRWRAYFGAGIAIGSVAGSVLGLVVKSAIDLFKH